MGFIDTRLDITTDSGGDATVTGEAINGLLYAVEWVDGDLADGVDATLSMTQTPSGVDKTLLTLTDANSDAFYYPRESDHDNTGTEGAGTVHPLLMGIPQVVVADGGNVASGAIILYWFRL